MATIVKMRWDWKIRSTARQWQTGFVYTCEPWSVYLEANSFIARNLAVTVPTPPANFEEQGKKKEIERLSQRSTSYLCTPWSLTFPTPIVNVSIHPTTTFVGQTTRGNRHGATATSVTFYKQPSVGRSDVWRPWLVNLQDAKSGEKSWRRWRVLLGVCGEMLEWWKDVLASPFRAGLPSLCVAGQRRGEHGCNDIGFLFFYSLRLILMCNLDLNRCI